MGLPSNPEDNSVSQGVETGSPCVLWAPKQSAVAAVEEEWGVLQKLNIDPASDPALPSLGTSPEEVKQVSRRYLWAMFIATLFKTARK